MVSVNRWDEETDVIVAGCGLSGAAAATKYLIAISGGRSDESLPRYFAQNLADNEEYLRKLAQPYNATVRMTTIFK